MIWFSSDVHFFHNNILKYSNRPFSTVEEMNDEIVNRWNSRILSDDTFYFLGDWAFALNGNPEKAIEIRRKIKCRNIHFILGNHDHIIRKYSDQLMRDQIFLSITDVFEVRCTKPSIWLSHYAHRTWPKMHHGRYHLYAHSHGTLPEDQNALSFDVGVDTNNFYPYSFDQVKEKMRTKSFTPIDHHNKETT